MSIKARLGKASIWISVSRGVVNLLGLVSTIVLARLLVPADFGLVALGTTVLSIVVAVTDTQMSQALIHHRNPTTQHLNAAWTLGLLRGLVLGGLCAASGPLMVSVFHDQRLIGVMMALGLTVLISGLANPRIVMFQRDLIFSQDFVLNVSSKVIGLIVSISVAYFYRSYWALMLGSITSQLATVAISYFIAPFRPQPTFQKLRELFSFSLWLSLSRVINTINWKFDQLLVGKFLGRTDLGLYTVGDNFAQLPTRETTSQLTQALFPAFAQLGGDRDRLRNAYRRAQAIVTAIALPMGVGTALVARPLVWVTMGEKWMPAALVIEILASVFAFQTMGTPAQPLAMAMGRTRLIFSRDVQLFVIRFPIIALGLYLDGIRGVLIARALAGSVAIVFNFYIVKNLIGFSFLEQLAANTRFIVGVGLMALVVKLIEFLLPIGAGYGDHIVALALMGSAGAITYFGTCYVWWRASGRPQGPETEMIALASKANSMIRRALPSRA